MRLQIPDIMSARLRSLACGFALMTLALLAPGALAENSAPEIVANWHQLELNDLEGNPWNARKLRGQFVLVDFWATWCVPCRAEFPVLRQARERFAGQGLQILGVSVDQIERRKLLRFIQRHDLGWPQVQQSRGMADEAALAFGVDSLPRSFLFDRQGRLLATDLRGEALLATLESLMPATSND